MRWQDARGLLEQLVNLLPVLALELARPAAPRQRQCAAAIGQRQRAQRALVGLLRVVQHQHTSPTWQVAHTGARERFEHGSRIPLGVRQGAAQAAFDGIWLGGRRHTPQLRGQTWQRRMPRYQQPGDDQRQAPRRPDPEVRYAGLQVLI